MSPFGEQLVVAHPGYNQHHRARLHTLPHHAAARQRFGQSTFSAVPRRARRKHIPSDEKADSVARSELSLISPRSAPWPSQGSTKSNQDATAEPQRFFQTVPLTPWLKHGQSDPFDALAITVTPEVNEIISFGRDVFLPTLSHTSGAKQSFIVNNSFQDNASQLSSEGPAFGLLSYLATAASRVAGGADWERKAIKYEVKCTTVLRAKIAKAPISQFPELITQILTLFGCTDLTGRVVEAKQHAKIIQTLFDSCAESGMIDIASLCFALYHDRNLSAMFLVRSSFDVDQWAPEIISPIWKMLGAPFPHLTTVSQQKLDKSITRSDTRFTKLIDNMRNHYHTVVLTRERWAQHITPPNLVMYHVSHSIIYELRLVNHYLDLTENSVSSIPPHDRWSQAYICLATLYMAHSLLYSGLVRLSDTSATLKQHLKNALLNAEQTATIQNQHRYGNARLWALFIGATAERIGNGASNDGSRWFTARFKAHLLRMGITRWSDVKKTILGFPCASELLEQDPAWVEHYLKPSYEMDGTVGTKEDAFRMYNNATGRFE